VFDSIVHSPASLKARPEFQTRKMAMAARMTIASQPQV